jgi:hypothetical protein
MADFDKLTWQEAMRRGHAALLDSEHLYDDVNASEGRSNLEIEKHLRRSEVKAAQAQVWLALARELGSQATATATRAPDWNLQVQHAVTRVTAGQRPRGAEAPTHLLLRSGASRQSRLDPAAPSHRPGAFSRSAARTG